MKKEEIVKKMIESTGLTVFEIGELIAEKQEQLKGLVSEEGALFIICKELGIEIDTMNEFVEKFDPGKRITIEQLQNQMKNVEVIGKIMRVFDIRLFTKKDGTEGQVLNLVLEDNTGKIKVVLWDNDANLYYEEDLKPGNYLKIINGYTKWSDYSNAYEIHVPRWGKAQILESVDEKDKEEFPEYETMWEDW